MKGRRPFVHRRDKKKMFTTKQVLEAFIEAQELERTSEGRVQTCPPPREQMIPREALATSLVWKTEASINRSTW